MHAATPSVHVDGEFPRLTDVAPVAARIALNVTGLAIFVPTLTLLWLRSERASIFDWALLAMCLLAWMSGQFVRSVTVRATIQLTAGVCLLLGALLLAPLGGPGWIMPTTIAFAVIVGATFSFGARTALIIVFAVAIIDAVVTQRGAPTAAFTEFEPLDGFIGPIMDIVAGTGLILARQATWKLFANTDQKQRELERAVERTTRESRIQLARESVERRIHETILNTLSGIAMGSIHRDAAQRAAKQDLRQLEWITTPMPDASLTELIQISVAAADLGPLEPIVAVESDALISSSIVSVLRDALVEVLRNVRLHSQASTVTITGSVGSSATISVCDNGVGFTPSVRERFGLRNSVRAGLTSLGGVVTIESEVGRGTTVTLAAPTLASRPMPARPLPAARILDESLLTRVGLLATNIFLGVVAIPLSRGLPHSETLLLLILLFVSSNALLAFSWRPWSRLLLPLISIVCASLIAFTLSRSPLECAQSASITWIITAISGGGALLMIRAYTHLLARVAVIATMALASFAMAAVLPSDCSSYAWSAAFVTLAYMAAVTYFFSWLDLRFENNRARMMDSWQLAVEERLNLEQRQVTTQEWARLSTDALELLTAISNNTVDVDTPAIQSRAAAATSDLRARMGRVLPGHSADTLIIPTTHNLAARLQLMGWTVESEVVIAPLRTDAYPDQLLDTLASFVRHTHMSHEDMPTLTMTWLTDDRHEEILLLFPGRIEPSTGHQSGAMTIDDCAVEILATAPKALVSVRRPVRP